MLFFYFNNNTTTTWWNKLNLFPTIIKSRRSRTASGYHIEIVFVPDFNLFIVITAAAAAPPLPALTWPRDQPATSAAATSTHVVNWINRVWWRFPGPKGRPMSGGGGGRQFEWDSDSVRFVNQWPWLQYTFRLVDPEKHCPHSCLAMDWLDWTWDDRRPTWPGNNEMKRRRRCYRKNSSTPLRGA